MSTIEAIVGCDVATGNAGSAGNERMTFEEALEELINNYSIESLSNTPDFILAEYLKSCLQVYNVIILKRDKFYSEDHSMPKDTQ